MASHHESIGNGPAIVFLHAALADLRMWQPQWETFADTNQLVRIDLQGFGTHPPGDNVFSRSANVLTLLDELGIDRAVFVGASMGGRVALDIAVGSPERVAGLMLIGAAISGHEWSEQVQAFWGEEDRAIEAGDAELAVELNLEFWLDGPERDPANLTVDQRDLVAQMQRTSIEFDIQYPDAPREDRGAINAAGRLAEISAPTTILYGNADVSDIETIARHLSAQIPHATLHEIQDTAHLPSFEAPEVCNALLTQLLTRC